METWYFIGIGGCGMAALAKIQLEKGNRVIGSDLLKNATVERLCARGATVHTRQTADNVSDDLDVVVYSTAIPQDHPELEAARALGLSVLHRSEALARLTTEFDAVNIAGSHGKTTTSSMLCTLMEQAKRSPTCVVGGAMELLGGNGKLGSGRILISEADESDGSFLNVHTYGAVITNIEDDHLEHYGSMALLEGAFRTFARNADPSGFVLLGIDCPRTANLADELQNAVTFGFHEEADYRAQHLHYRDRRQVFDVLYGGRFLMRVSIHMPGRHNVLNALAAAASAHLLGLTPAEIVRGFESYRGVNRRFSIRGECDGITFVDDYAHHPTEIQSLLRGARELRPNRLVVLFQPHRYTRTKQFLHDFAAALEESDLAWVTDVYSAGEPTIPGVSAAALVAASQAEHVRYGGTLEETANAALDALAPGDLVLTVGAGDVTDIARAMLNNLDMRRNTRQVGKIADLGRYVTWGAGGRAANLYEPATEEQVLALSRDLPEPWMVFGRGSNLLFSDGLHTRPLIHLGARFARVTRKGNRLIAQCGASLQQLAREAQRHGLSGLEELACIPGSLGGALYMNAGTKARSIWELTCEIVLADRGQPHVVPRSEVQADYRHTGFMDKDEPVLIMQAVLELEPDDPECIQQRMDDALARRKTQPGGRSAGSTFKNPPQDSAGRLLEACGLKGRRMGGAMIAYEHANFILNTGGASATDIEELIRFARQTVLERCGIQLEPEVRLIHC